MDTTTKYQILQDPSYLTDQAIDLIKEREVLSYPELLNQLPSIDINKLSHRIDWLIELGHPIRRIEGKGFVYGDFTPEEATEMLRSVFVTDVLTQAEYCETYIHANVYGIEYNLIQNTTWPLGIQNLLIINSGIDNPYSIEFQERSISYKILIFLLTNPRHVITNYQLAQLVAATGGNIEYYDSLSVYRWFDYLRNTYGIPLMPVQGMGWGMTNTQIEESEQLADMEARLNSEWLRFFQEDIATINCSTVGEVAGTKFFFPKLNMGFLPRHAFVLTQDLNGEVRVFDLQTLHSVKRTFESLVRNGGYIDRYTIVKHSQEQWWQDQLLEDQQRTNFITSERAKAKVVDVASEDGYEYAIKRLKDFLEANDLPNLLPHSSESGYVLSSVPKVRREFIKERMLRGLRKVLGKNLIGKGYPEEYGLETYEVIKEYGLKLIVFDLATLEGKSGEEMFQPSIYKTHGAILVRDIYSAQDVYQITVAIELNSSQASFLEQFKNPSTLDISNMTKRERDQVARILKGMVAEFVRAGFALEEGTGKIENNVATLPVPVCAEG